ncbi:hypothetical protein BC834DRAFT_968937 [Gloeopeniophorella convolvens]|nr:hypothetical protein BC834DRAFT_968937 [Gloeopeniophorella convolvens]
MPPPLGGGNAGSHLYTAPAFCSFVPQAPHIGESVNNFSPTSYLGTDVCRPSSLAFRLPDECVSIADTLVHGNVRGNRFRAWQDELALTMDAAPHFFPEQTSHHIFEQAGHAVGRPMTSSALEIHAGSLPKTSRVQGPLDTVVQAQGPPPAIGDIMAAVIRCESPTVVLPNIAVQTRDSKAITESAPSLPPGAKHLDPMGVGEREEPYEGRVKKAGVEVETEALRAGLGISYYLLQRLWRR